MPDDPIPTPPRRGLAAVVGAQRPADDPADKPSLLAALAKVLGANLLDVVSPELADGMAERVMDHYAEAGGDPGKHATLFGLAGATGATIPPALMALSGSTGARVPKTTSTEAFLRSLDTSPVGRAATGANPLEYIRPRGTMGGGMKAASALALLTRQPTDR